jgi:hypothetical protein
MSFWFVSVVPKYLNAATFPNDSLAALVFWFCPKFGWRDIIIYFVFSAFVSRPTFLLAPKIISVFCFTVFIRVPFAKFVDSSYYSEFEVRGGAVTVSFSKYIPWQAINFLQRSIHISKTCCRPLITSKFLISELPFHGWKSPEITWGKIWTVWRIF